MTHDAAVTRRGLSGMLRTAATGVDGVSGATVKVRRRRARDRHLRRPRPGRAEAHTEPVTQAARARLDQLGLRYPPR